MALSLCAGIAANTGGIDCDISMGIPSQFAIWGGKLELADYANQSGIQTALDTAAELPNGNANKLFMFPVIQEVTDSSEANTEGTLGLGFKTIIREGVPAYTFKVFAGFQQVKALRKFNNTTVPVLMFDKNNRVWGSTKGADFVGASARIYVSGLKFATGQAVEEGVVTIILSYLDAKSVSDNGAYVEVTSTTGMQGLNDVILSESAAHVSNVYKIQAIVPTGEMGGGVNVGDQYPTELVAGAWYAKTGVGFGTTLAITSVTKAGVGWDVTLDSTAFGALSSGASIKIGWVDPAVLNATYDVTGLEATPVVVIK